MVGRSAEIRGKLVSVSVGAAAGGGASARILKTAKCGTRGKFMCTLLRLLKQTRERLIHLVLRVQKARKLSCSHW